MRAQKPLFFTPPPPPHLSPPFPLPSSPPFPNAFYLIDTETSLEGEEVKNLVLTPPLAPSLRPSSSSPSSPLPPVYSGGWVGKVRELLEEKKGEGEEGEGENEEKKEERKKEVVYFGDHLVGDLKGAISVGWHSVGVVEELVKKKKGEEEGEREGGGGGPPGAMGRVSCHWGGFFSGKGGGGEGEGEEGEKEFTREELVMTKPLVVDSSSSSLSSSSEKSFCEAQLMLHSTLMIPDMELLSSLHTHEPVASRAGSNSSLTTFLHDE